jgi:adenylate cyclase
MRALLRRLQAGRSLRLSIAAYLSLGFGGLMLVAVAGVLAMSLYANWRNTSELLFDKSRLILGALTGQIQQYLDPAAAKTDWLAQQIEEGAFATDRQAQLLEVVATLMGGAPQIHAMAYLDASGWLALAARDAGRIDRKLDWWQNDPSVVADMRAAAQRSSDEPYWEAPIYVARVGTVLNLRRPIRRDGVFRGMAVATVRVADLSSFVAALETEIGQNAFVLYDQRFVLAHRALEFDFPGLDRNRPLPTVTEVGDPVLFEIWADGWQDHKLIAGSGHGATVAGREYIYLYAPLDHYADAPWLVGSYFAADDIATQFTRLAHAALLGLGGLVLAVLAAFALGRLLRRPIARLAAAAAAVRELDLDAAPVLGRSHFRELDDAARAFDSMLAGLRAFARYMPKSLVLRLIARGEVEAVPVERTVTVLFTDVVGFTARTEQLGAAATAAFLNEHFSLLTACIEAEGGTIDKYIGDAVMALWGALEPQPDHALRAARAARAIAAALHADNAGRAQPVRLRMGLHTGPVVVGNIGTATRMSYTVVGDTVNAAQRLEALAKDLVPEAEVAILLSAATAAGLPEEIATTSLGHHALRGRGAATEVFALCTGPLGRPVGQARS